MKKTILIALMLMSVLTTTYGQVNITFPNGNLTYIPFQSSVAQNGTVTFSGNFAGHPMIEVSKANWCINSPILLPGGVSVNTGTSYTLNTSATGDRYFVCVPHATIGEKCKVSIGCNTSAPTGVTTQTVTQGATLNDLLVNGTDVKWYTSSSSTCPISNSTQLDNGTTYYATQTIGGCESTAQLSVNVALCSTPSIYVLSGGGSYCNGGAGVSIALSGSETNVNYQLKNGATNVGLAVAGTGSAINFNNITASGTYSVEATTTTGGCTSDMSGSVNVTPIDPIIISSSPSSYTICEGKPVTFSAAVQGNALVYQWRKNTVNISGGNNSYYTIPSVANADAANYDLLVTGICGDPSLAGNPIFSPSNPITSFGGGSPSGEEVENAIDGDVNTKYLDYNGVNSGFNIDAGTSKVANMIMLTTANDSPERDPLNYEVYGSNDDVTFNLITNGSLPCNSTRFFSNYFAINNSTAYRYYRFKVTALCNMNATNLMQIAEVQLYSDVTTSTLTTSAGSLTVKPSSYGDTTATACTSFNWNGNDYSSSGNYVHAYTNYLGCDSLVTLHLTLLNDVTYNPQTVCFGKTYTFNGNTYSGNGNFNDTLQNKFGCDSIIVTQLTELALIKSYNWHETPAGVPYLINGNTYTVSGNYSDTLTSSIGCDSIVFTRLVVIDLPSVSNSTICSNSTATLLGNSIDNNFWYGDLALTNLLSTSINYTTPTLTNTTTYYVAGAVSLDYFKLDTILGSNSLVNDHDDLTGDDRGGIAVTPNYVYITGDDYTGRFTVDLTDSIQLPLRDGLFSDLKSGKIYSISNGTELPEYYDLYDNNDTYNFTEIVELNDTLEPTTNVITLSQPIVTGNYNTQAGIFAGKGFMVVYSGYDYKWYAVSLTTGKVDELGYLGDAEFQGSENWADWGVAEFDGTSYSVIYRDYNDNNIHRRVLPDSASTVIGSFSDLYDMANITYSPWNNRWYFHHENESEFGGDSETIGYADASDSSSVIKVPSPFAKAVTVTVNALPTVSVSSGAICAGQSFTMVPTGAATYTYSSGTDVVTPSTNDSYTVTGTDANGCVSPTGAVSTVTVNALPVLVAVTNNTLLCVSQTATLSVSGATTYTWNTTANTTTVAVSPTIQTTYTVIGADANGCTNSATITQNVSLCTGIESPSNDATIKLYPNPNNGVFVIELIATSNVTVTNALGQVIIEKTFESGKHHLDINNETTGVYFVKVSENDKQQIIKVIKE